MDEEYSASVKETVLDLDNFEGVIFTLGRGPEGSLVINVVPSTNDITLGYLAAGISSLLHTADADQLSGIVDRGVRFLHSANFPSPTLNPIERVH